MSALVYETRQSQPLVVFATMLFFYARCVSTQSDCPWDQSGLLLWSDPTTWDNGTVPGENFEVTIKSGKHVLLNVQPATLNNLTIEANASLIWGNVPNLELQLEYMLVDGAFHMGSKSCRLKEPAAIKLRGRSDSKYAVGTNRKFLGVRKGGTLELHGKRKTSWTRLAQSIPALSDLPCAFIYDHADQEANPFAKERRGGLHVIVWNKDGTVFDFNIFQPYTDLKDFVASVPNGNVIGMFAFTSTGLGSRSDASLNFTALDDVIINDLGGELISKVTESDSYSLLTKKGSKATTVEHYKHQGRINLDPEDYLKLPDWNQNLDFQVATSAKTNDQYFRVLSTDVAYPILELADKVKGWSAGDKIVVASTDYDWEQVEVREIVYCRGSCSKSQIRVNGPFLYRHYGNFTYNVDERAEVGMLSRSIVIEGVMEDQCYSTDSRGEMLCERFGQDTFGAHVKAMLRPTYKGWSFTTWDSSLLKSGIMMDSKISTGKLATEKGMPENGILQVENEYDPRDPAGDANGLRVSTTMERVTLYKNCQENLWLKGGNVNVTFSSFADAPQSFTGGTTGTDTGTSVEYSVFVGQTGNLGQPTLYTQKTDSGVTLRHQFDGSFCGTPWKTVTGISIYQGPMYVKHSYFDRYFTWYWNDSWTQELGSRPVRYGGAVSFKKDNTYPTATSQYTTNLTFGFCDGVNEAHWLFFGNSSLFDWRDRDGTRAAHTLDRDGSLTGTPNTYIVRNRPFFTGPECLYRPDWDMSVCPYRYIKMEVLGSDGNLDSNLRDKYPLIVRRDNQPNDPFHLAGESRREYLLRTHSSYLVDFNTTVEGAMFPSEIKIYGYGVESQDVVRVGICMPKDMTEFEIRSTYPVFLRNTNFTRVYTMEDLDADTENNAIYHDTVDGIIFFKIWSRHDRTNDSQQCPGGNCYHLKITLKNGDRSKIRTCFGAKYPHFVDNRPTPATPVQPSCQGISSPEGLGAVRWNEVTKIVHEDFSVPCISRQPAPGSGLAKYVGCYVADTQQFQLRQDFANSMTREWCTTRCYQRNFQYAGLTVKKRCMCGKFLNTSKEALNIKTRNCSQPCTGNSVQSCGGVNRLDVLTTGLPL